MKHFYSHGKLLLTGEYVVLDGAKALALPTQKGQHMQVVSSERSGINWTSKLHDGSTWFSHHFELDQLRTKNWRSDQKVVETLQHILETALSISNISLTENHGFEITSILEFPRNWGLGSSSTLLNNIAQWLDINPYTLLSQTFGGSGYDIACATAKGPICYQRGPEHTRVNPVAFDPPFKETLFFVHLNTKQNSRESIQHYRGLQPEKSSALIKSITALTNKLLLVETLNNFEHLLFQHETQLAKVLKLSSVKERLFPDYPGAIKSLGGWGGDFILATGDTSRHDYFKQKGFSTIIPYSEMILH
ncbi:MAG: GYDIA family GHMP kinase [Dokdonia sp.]